MLGELFHVVRARLDSILPRIGATTLVALPTHWHHINREARILMADDLDTEVDANFDAFRTMLPDLMTTNPGRYVLLRHRQAADFFDDMASALSNGMQRYPDQMFSVQEITTRAADLGFFSHAVDLGFA